MERIINSSAVALYACQKFVDSYYEIIGNEITARHQQLGKGSMTNDPFSVDSCRLAVHAIEEAVLKRFFLFRAGAFVKAYPQAYTEDAVNHSYFASSIATEIVLDFTAGQFALLTGTTLEKWIMQYPHLFVNKALLCTKKDAETLLGIEYPLVDTPFNSFYFGK
jgi:hypothetical protein